MFQLVFINGLVIKIEICYAIYRGNHQIKRKVKQFLVLSKYKIQ